MVESLGDDVVALLTDDSCGDSTVSPRLRDKLCKPGRRTLDRLAITRHRVDTFLRRLVIQRSHGQDGVHGLSRHARESVRGFDLLTNLSLHQPRREITV